MSKLWKNNKKKILEKTSENCFSIFYGRADLEDYGQSGFAEMFECSDFIRFNGLTDISFVFKNILNAHVVLGPSLRLGVDQVFETGNTIRMNCLRQETLKYKYVDVKLNLP